MIRTDWIAASMAALGTILNWLGNHPHPDELWLMRALTPLGVRGAGPRLSSTGSERGPAFLGDEHDPWKIRMSNPAAANAIAEYLNSGGQVRKGDEPTPATAQEIIVYLASRGIPARYCPGDAKLYLCRGKRMSAGKLVEIANRFRRAENLQPFALKLDPLDLKAGSGDLRSSM